MAMAILKVYVEKKVFEVDGSTKSFILNRIAVLIKALAFATSEDDDISSLLDLISFFFEIRHPDLHSKPVEDQLLILGTYSLMLTQLVNRKR